MEHRAKIDGKLKEWPRKGVDTKSSPDTGSETEITIRHIKNKKAPAPTKGVVSTLSR